MIVVLDSNVWISAFNFGGLSFGALENVLRYHTIAICNEIIFEVGRILIGKFDWSDAEVDRELSQYIADALQIEVAGELRGACRDPNDDMILECAVLANADMIVTGDRDLLVLGSYRNIRIVTVREYLELSSPAS